MVKRLVHRTAVRDFKHALSLCIAQVANEDQVAPELVDLAVPLFTIDTVVGVNSTMAYTHSG